MRGPDVFFQIVKTCVAGPECEHVRRSGDHAAVVAEASHLMTDPRFVEISGEVAGREAKSVLACRGSDGRFFAAEKIPVILSRPHVGNFHGRDEWIEIESMLDYFEICRRYVLECTELEADQ